MIEVTDIRSAQQTPNAIKIVKIPEGDRVDQDGDELPPVPEPSPGPAKIEKFQLLQAVNAAGKRTLFDTLMAQADQVTKDAWFCIDNVERRHPFVLAFQQAAAMTDLEMDELFSDGATYQL